MSADFAFVINFVKNGVLPQGMTVSDVIDNHLARKSSVPRKSAISESYRLILAEPDAARAKALLCATDGIAPMSPVEEGRMDQIVQIMARRRAGEIRTQAEGLLAEAGRLGGLAG